MNKTLCNDCTGNKNKRCIWYNSNGCKPITNGNPYFNDATAGYCVAMNMLTLYLYMCKDPAYGKTYPEEQYKHDMNLISALDIEHLEHLCFMFEFNQHINTLAAQISQGDFDNQLEQLFAYLGGLNKSDDN